MSKKCKDRGLTFQCAKQHVETYNGTKDSLMQAHEEAMDCYDCEAFLQLGIDAFDWLVRSDLVIRQAIYSEQYEHDPEIEEAIRKLAKAWLNPYDYAMQWVNRQKERGYSVSNLKRFEECHHEVRAIVDAFECDSVMPDALAPLMEEALQEHKNGQTAEFF